MKTIRIGAGKVRPALRSSQISSINAQGNPRRILLNRVKEDIGGMPIPIDTRCCHEVTGDGVREGIRVNAVAPGHIKTPMQAPEAYDALRAFNPIGRIGETRDISDAILFVDSAPFIIGKILHVGGGQSAGH